MATKKILLQSKHLDEKFVIEDDGTKKKSRMAEKKC